MSGYFELLGLTPALNLDLAGLQKSFYERSRQWHPDRFARKSEAERRHALEMSSQLNDAYRTLRDPVQRALYVLSQEGFESGPERSAEVPPELLEEVFEFNMALEELRGGDSSVRPQLEAARAAFGAMLEEAGAKLEGLFAAWDSGRSRETLGEIRSLLDRRKYIQNLVNEVEKELAGAA